MKKQTTLLNWKMKAILLLSVALFNTRHVKGQIMVDQWDVINGIVSTTTQRDANINGATRMGQYLQIGDMGYYGGVNGWKNPSLWIKSWHFGPEGQNHNQISLTIDNWQDYTASNPYNIVEVKRRDVSGATSPDYPFLILGNGKVTMGVDPATTNLNGDFRLFVGTGILTEKVEVKVSGAWPDYVFKEDYKLASLKETEAYIKANQHLPGVPSAAEIQENGLNLGDMDATLLQKIEELTLHMIELKKENDNLRARLEKLEQ